MPIGVALLVVVSALVHASWNAILKRSRDPEDAVLGAATVSAITAILVALALHPSRPTRVAIAWSVASGLLEAGYFVTLARALSLGPLGPVYTIVRGGALVVVWPVSMLFLNEPLGPRRGLGTALVLLGLVATGGPTPLGVRAVAVAAVSAVFVGGYNLSYKMALSSGGRPEIVVAISISTACVLAAAALGRARLRRSVVAARAQPLHVVSAGVLSTLSFVVFLAAMERAGTGLVLTLRNTSILFAQLLAVALGERPSRFGIAGSVLVVAGAILLAA